MGIYRVQLCHLSKLFTVKRIISHPDFSLKTLQFDISILEINGQFQWTDYVRPVCIPSPQFKAEDRAVCMLAGWGNTDEGNDYEMLNYATIPVVGKEKYAFLN